MKAIADYFQYVGNQLLSISVVDVIDILLVAFIFYYVFQFMRKRRAGKLLVGILLLIVMLLISSITGMKALNFILTNLFSMGILSLIVVFQPELRSFLEKVGGTPFRNFHAKGDQEGEIRTMISEVCTAAQNLADKKTGALIVFERATKLGDQIRTGTVLDANVSSYLLENIFFNKAPLHDGAVIISGVRINSAGCFLPLSTNNDLHKDLGTRHRSGIGMSENSDAIVVIVSEETGTISVAMEGELQRGFDKSSLENLLDQLLLNDTAITEKVFSQLKDRFTRKGGNSKDED